MNIMAADITRLWKEGQVVCVTTNGFVKRSGEAVMGRGNALAMAKLIPELPRKLGDHIKLNGNHVGFIYDRVIAFPVKPISGTYDMALSRVSHLYKPGKIVPGFHCQASIEIIARSVRELNELVASTGIDKVYLPLPGVGNGGLQWQKVAPVLQNLDSRVLLVKWQAF